jgi:hypothetical protein
MRASRGGAAVLWGSFGAVAMAMLAPGGAAAVLTGPSHVSDGTFTSPGEWDTSRSTVTVFNFPVVGNTGGANLFVEQSGGVLYLMYDYVNSASLGLNATNFATQASFDVFFQVPNDQPGGTDYLVHIGGGSFSEYEKPTNGPASPLNPDGSLDFNSPVWTPLSADDQKVANFHAAIGFGHNPATPSVPDHVLAEFDLTIQSPSNPGGGFYDPAPAFWSASANGPGGGLDPPISSGIFQLNPDGTMLVIPVLGANGGPVAQPQDAVPEPASLALTGLGLALLAAGRCRRLARECRAGALD